MTCFRYFGFTSFDQVDRLTIREFRILMDAYQLKSVDDDFRQHAQAYLNFQVQARKKSGKKLKPVYKNFKDFYDYEREVGKASGKIPTKKQRFSGLADYLRKKAKESEGGS